MKHQNAESFEPEKTPDALKKHDSGNKDAPKNAAAKPKSKVAMRRRPVEPTVEPGEDPWALPAQTASVLGLGKDNGGDGNIPSKIALSASVEKVDPPRDGLKLSEETDAAVARFNEILEYSKSFSALAEESVSSDDDEYEEVVYTATSLEGEPVTRKMPAMPVIEKDPVAVAAEAGPVEASVQFEPTATTGVDDESIISSKDIADAVMELEIGEDNARAPNFFEIRHGVRQLQFKYLGEVPYTNDIRGEFETILEMLSQATVQFRTMQDKYGQFQAFRENAQKEREKFNNVLEAKKAAEEAVSEISRDLAFAQQENSSLVGRCADMEREVKLLNERQKEVLAEAEEARQQLLDHEATFKSDYEKAQLFEAENEVLRKSLSDACDTIVKGSSAQMMAEYRIQELEDKIASLVSMRISD